jgi:hypothetical protein
MQSFRKYGHRGFATIHEAGGSYYDSDESCERRGYCVWLWVRFIAMIDERGLMFLSNLKRCIIADPDVSITWNYLCLCSGLGKGSVAYYGLL